MPPIGGGQDGAGAGSAAGIGAGFFTAALRLGAAFLAFFFAGAAFFFFPGFFFAFDFFAMIVLPIQVEVRRLPWGDRVHATITTENRSARCRGGAHRRKRPMVP